LPVTVSTRNVSYYRDPAVILIDQLKEVYIDGELDTVDTTNWYPKIMRKDYTVGLNITESGLDDPDPLFYENYVCGAARNYTSYCNPETDKLVSREEAGGGRCPPDPVLRPWRCLLAAAAEGADHDGQQHL